MDQAKLNLIWSLNDTSGKGLIEKIEVLKDIGQVLLEFKSSPNVCLLCTFLDEYFSIN